MDFRFYLSLFLRRLPLFLAFCVLGASLGFTLASILPPTFVARAQLLVESEQIPESLAESTVQVAATEQLQIIQQRITTRAQLIDLANRMQIYGSDAPPPDDIVADLRKRISIVTSGGGGTARQAQATTVAVSFHDADPQRAAAVTNEVVTMILQEDVAMRTGVSSDTLAFFTQEVARLDKEVALASERLLKFREANKDALPDSLDYRRTRQEALQEQLLQIGRDEAGLKDRRARLVELYQNTGLVAVDPGNATPEQRQLQQLREQLSAALAVYAPQNPRVVMLRNQIAALEAVVAGQAPTAAAGGGAPSAYDVQLTEIDSQLAQLGQDRTRVSAQLEEVSRTIDATPGNAITLATMERDYENVRAQYDQAVARKAQAETGDLIEAMSKGQRIGVIEQAVVPQSPESPNRPLIAIGGLAGGMAAGFGLVLLLELMNSAIRRPTDIIAKLGITPFATLPLLRTAEERRRRALGIGVLFVVVGIGLPLALIGVHFFVIPLQELPSRLALLLRGLMA